MSEVKTQRRRFGEFEVDLVERELHKGGLKVKLQRKPFQMLEVLLEHPGALVTRTQLAQRLWPHLHISYERCLNTAVNALREALGDSPKSPRFIETCPGLGYRFIAPVKLPDSSDKAGTDRIRPTEGRADYLKGRFFLNKMSAEGLTTAGAHFNFAIQQDPRAALPNAGLAEIHSRFALWGILRPREAGSRAEEYANSALWLAPDRPEPYVAMAGVKRILDWDWPGAKRLYEKALELDPDYTDAHVWYADLQLACGRSGEAIQHLQVALDLDPSSLLVNVQLAWAFFVTADLRGGLEQAWNALMLDPKCGMAQYLLGLIYGEMGMVDEALTELQNARVACPMHSAVLAAEGYIHAKNGSEHRAREILEELGNLSKKRYVSPYWSAVLHAGLQQDDTALAALEDASQDRDISVQWVNVDRRFSKLRSSVRFKNLAV